MRIIIIIFSICLLSSFVITAQNSFEGKILDINNDPIFFTTIALYNTLDSTIVKTASTDQEGRFSLLDIPTGTYYMEATMLGYQKSIQNNLSIPNKDNDFIQVTLEDDTNILETVEIKSRRPLLEQHSDKLVVNVAENITSLNTNLLDVMAQVPGVIVMGDRIKLAGSSNLTILINGKTTKYMDVESLMRDMPGDNIQKVEIIHQPGAEYDAAGTGPIINVILKKNSLFGTSGSVNIGMSKAKLYSGKTGINMSHYQGDVNINMGVGYVNYNNTSSLTLDRWVTIDNYQQFSDESKKGRSYRANLSMDWDISDKHKLGFQSRMVNHYSLENNLNTTSIDFAEEPLHFTKIETSNITDASWKLRSINPYYTFEIDTSGQKLDFDFNLINFKSTSENILNPEDIIRQIRYQNLKYNQPGDTYIYVGKLDYTYPINMASKLRFGVKHSSADLDNNFQATQDVNGIWENNTAQSNHFLFKESISAFYGKYNYKKDDWAGTFGLRYENSNSEGQSIGVDTILSRSVKKLFPSASLSKDIIKGLAGILSYSYRLDRPRYSSLNPFRYSIDSYTSYRGNPELKPEFTHSMKFTLAYQRQPFFNIEYKKTVDAMVEIIEQDDNTGEGFKGVTNLASREGLNINLGFPLSFIPGVSGYGYLAANRTAFDAPYLDAIFNQSSWDYTFATSVNFTLPGEINTQISGWYNSGGFEGLLTSEWMYGTNIGISKRFFDDKLKLSLGVQNPVSRFYHGNVKYSNINVNIIKTWDAPVFNIQLHYKFGNQHFKRKKKHKSGASDELKRTDSE